jgi:hypothetical protein
VWPEAEELSMHAGDQGVNLVVALYLHEWINVSAVFVTEAAHQCPAALRVGFVP